MTAKPSQWYKATGIHRHEEAIKTNCLTNLKGAIMTDAIRCTPTDTPIAGVEDATIHDLITHQIRRQNPGVALNEVSITCAFGGESNDIEKLYLDVSYPDPSGHWVTRFNVPWIDTPTGGKTLGALPDVDFTLPHYPLANQELQSMKYRCAFCGQSKEAVEFPLDSAPRKESNKPEKEHNPHTVGKCSQCECDHLTPPSFASHVKRTLRRWVW